MALRPLALVLAMSDAGVIGQGGALPCLIPEDMSHFKAVTLGHAVIMGRKTYESIGKPLPGRTNVVVTRSPSFEAPGCLVARSLDDAIERARAVDDEPRVIGGAEIYRLALPFATRVFLTEVHRDVAGNTRMERLDRESFREVSRRRAESEPDVEFVELERLEVA